MDTKYGHTLTFLAPSGEEVVFKAPHEIELPQLLGLIERYLRASGYVFDAHADLTLTENAR